MLGYTSNNDSYLRGVLFLDQLFLFGGGDLDLIGFIAGGKFKMGYFASQLLCVDTLAPAIAFAS